MKFTCRPGIFETNSSSTHAMILTQEKKESYNFPEYVNLTGEEYGREEMVLSDLYDKLNFLFSMIVSYTDGAYQLVKFLSYLQMDHIRVVYSPFAANIVKDYKKAARKDGATVDLSESWNICDYGVVDSQFISDVLESLDSFNQYAFDERSLVFLGRDSTAWVQCKPTIPLKTFQAREEDVWDEKHSKYIRGKEIPGAAQVPGAWVSALESYPSHTQYIVEGDFRENNEEDW